MVVSTSGGAHGRDLLYWIYFLEVRIFQQAQPSNAKESMENINHITGPVCEPSHDRILSPLDLEALRSIQMGYLTTQYEVRKSFAIDPVEPADHG